MRHSRVATRLRSNPPSVVKLKARLDRLTPREREVLALLVDGHMNKVIAGRLGISTRTAEHHRAHIMAKMEAPTLSHLIRSTQGFLNLLRPA